MDENWSRTDQKRANRAKEEALARLSDDLSRVSEAKLTELGLSEDLFDAILDLQRMKSAPARNRQLARVRALLRDADFATIRTRLVTLRETGSVNKTPIDDEANRLEASWTMRLLGEGEVGLDAFLREFPRADRTHLRTLVRNVSRAKHDRRERAEQKLRAALRGSLR